MLNFRRFTSADAAFCFKVRSRAFIQMFYGELEPREVSAAVNAYMPENYIGMANEMEFFIAEKDEVRIGFFTIRQVDEETAEIPLIYLDLPYLRKGIGKACLSFIENWILNHWPSVKAIFLDTVIPKYNSAFYEKAGYIPYGQVTHKFPDLQVKALRLKKLIR